MSVPSPPVEITPIRFDPQLYDGVLWRRTFAYAIDLIILALLTLPIGLFFILGGLASFGLLWMPLPFLWLGLNLLYYALLVGGAKASTWGQRLMGLRASTLAGWNPSFLQALLQVALFYVSFVATPLVLLVGLFNKRGRLIHDMLSGTVIKKRR